MSKENPTPAPSEGRVVHNNDLQFTIVAKAYATHVEFSVYDIEGWADEGKEGAYSTPLWHRAGASSHPDTVQHIEDAEVYLHGSVKWDGCSDWYFDEQDRVMLHGCSRRDVQRFGDVMALCWDMAAEMIQYWDGRE